MTFIKTCLRNSPSECNCSVSDTLFSVPGLPTLHKDKPQTVLTARAPKTEFKGCCFFVFFVFFFATKPAPIKQHTRAEKRKFKELWGNLLRVSVRLRHRFPLGAADRIVSEIRSRHCPPVAFFVLSHPPAGFSVPPTLNPSSVFWSTRIICLCVWKLFCLFTANQTVKCTG